MRVPMGAGGVCDEGGRRERSGAEEGGVPLVSPPPPASLGGDPHQDRGPPWQGVVLGGFWGVQGPGRLGKAAGETPKKISPQNKSRLQSDEPQNCKRGRDPGFPVAERLWQSWKRRRAGQQSQPDRPGACRTGCTHPQRTQRRRAQRGWVKLERERARSNYSCFLITPQVGEVQGKNTRRQM